MKHYHKALIDALDELMIALSKQKKLGLDPEVNNALKVVTKTRNDFKRAFNLRLLAEKNANDSIRKQQ